MADRKQFVIDSQPNPNLIAALERARRVPVTEADLQEQRVSFAFGNALNRDFVTRDSVIHSSQHIRLKA